MVKIVNHVVSSLFDNLSQLLHRFAINSYAFDAILQVGAEESMKFATYLIVELNLLQAFVHGAGIEWSVRGFIGMETD